MPKLFAFDLDGTLLNSEKKLTPANIQALKEMAENGAVVALASGRSRSSILQYVPLLSFDCAMLTANGAAVYRGSTPDAQIVYEAPLGTTFSRYLINHAHQKPFALNFYHKDNLYSIRNERTSTWIDLYYQQTRTKYTYLESFDSYLDTAPSKVIFVGDPRDIDEEEKRFRELWGESVYICRTWDHYLEFLCTDANKGKGVMALAKVHGIDMADVVTFGDANNDIPMLETAGLGIAMQNAPDAVKKAASRVSPWSNDEDGVAKEWQRLKQASPMIGE